MFGEEKRFKLKFTMRFNLGFMIRIKLVEDTVVDEAKVKV